MTEELRSELKVIQYYFNKRVDTLETSIKDDFDSTRKDIADIKNSIDKHLSYCDALMGKHEKKVDKLSDDYKEFKNRALGAVGIIVFIVSVVVAVWAGSR